MEKEKNTEIPGTLEVCLEGNHLKKVQTIVRQAKEIVADQKEKIDRCEQRRKKMRMGFIVLIMAILIIPVLSYTLFEQNIFTICILIPALYAIISAFIYLGEDQEHVDSYYVNELNSICSNIDEEVQNKIFAKDVWNKEDVEEIRKIDSLTYFLYRFFPCCVFTDPNEAERNNIYMDNLLAYSKIQGKTIMSCKKKHTKISVKYFGSDGVVETTKIAADLKESINIDHPRLVLDSETGHWKMFIPYEEV